MVGLEKIEALLPQPEAEIKEVKMDSLIRWTEQVYVPKDGKFRPLYLYLVFDSSQLLSDLSGPTSLGDLKNGRLSGTYFVTTVYDEPTDHSFINDVLVPYLREVNRVKDLKWDVRSTRVKGLYGVIISGRLAATLIQAMNHVSPRVPYLFSILFTE